ncbi:MAG: hypothetical protein R3E56_17280 [Burkholderiaceae bacterium]
MSAGECLYPKASSLPARLRAIEHLFATEHTTDLHSHVQPDIHVRMVVPLLQLLRQEMPGLVVHPDRRFRAVPFAHLGRTMPSAKRRACSAAA